MTLPYAVRVEEDHCDGQICYMAYHPELPGSMAQGNTPEEAVASLKEARADYIRVLLKRGLEIPLPEIREEEPILKNGSLLA